MGDADEDVQRLLELQDGWYDGEGLAPTTHARQVLHDILRAMPTLQAVTAEPEGGIDLNFGWHDDVHSSGTIKADGSVVIRQSTRSQEVVVHRFPTPVVVTDILFAVLWHAD